MLHLDRRVLWAVVVNMLLTVAQIIGGILAGSLSLIADALHNFSDALSLGSLSWPDVYPAGRPTRP